MRPQHCETLAASVHELGAELPADLTAILDTLSAVKAWSPTLPTGIDTLIKTGKFNATNATKLLNDQLQVPAVGPQEVRSVATDQLVRQFQRTLSTSGADAIIESLRPTFDTACVNLNSIRDLIGTNPTPEAVLDAGHKAAEAWRDLVVHRQTLDRINTVLQSFLLDFDLITGYEVFDKKITAARAAFFVGNEATSLDTAGRWLFAEANQGRGGRWLRLLETTELSLNTLTRAREIVAHQAAGYQETQQRQFAATHSG